VATANSDGLRGAIVVAVPAGHGSQPGLPLGDEDPAPRPGERLYTRTDEKGHYKMEAPVGAYLVMAEAEGYDAQWFHGATNRDDATPVKVEAAKVTEGVSFRLRKAEGPGDPEPPNPSEHGIISGIVLGPDGHIGGAVLTALPARSNGLPLEMPVGPRDEPVPDPETDNPRTRTDEGGNYRLVVPVGAWIVRCEAEGFVTQHYVDPGNPNTPKVFVVRNGDTYDGVNFEMVPGVLTAIKGRVTVKGTERGIEGAIIWGLTVPDPNLPGVPVVPRVQVRTATEKDGTYVLHVPAGTFAVGVVIHPQNSDPDTAALWWDNKDKLADADLIAIAKGEVVEGINFAVARTNVDP
jgi:hypothetical protein